MKWKREYTEDRTCWLLVEKKKETTMETTILQELLRGSYGDPFLFSLPATSQ